MLTLLSTAEPTGMTEEAAPGGNELSPTDAAILEMIREGRYDAEIASRLYISTADVKARIERMLAQGGLRERSDFITPPKPEPDVADGEPPPLERRARTMPVHNAVLAIVGALAIGVGVGWLARDEQAGGEPQDPDWVVTLSPDHLDSFADADVSATLDRLTADEAFRLLSGMNATPERVAPVDLGPLFVVIGATQSIDSLAYNAERHRLATLTGNAIAGEFAGWKIQLGTSDEVTMIRQTKGRVIIVRMETLNDQTRFSRDGDRIAVATTDGSRPRVEIWVEGAPWDFGLDGRLVVYL